MRLQSYRNLRVLKFPGRYWQFDTQPILSWYNISKNHFGPIPLHTPVGKLYECHHISYRLNFRGLQIVFSTFPGLCPAPFHSCVSLCVTLHVHCYERSKVTLFSLSSQAPGQICALFSSPIKQDQVYHISPSKTQEYSGNSIVQ